ncbi:class I SAM-dependent methyltransferase [Mycoplasmatota bacterium]|nr:class I SAM-dependent methyltransferase [Mycoplasmatota bacterium]
MENEIVVELFEIIDESNQYLMKELKVSYLNALFMTSRNILEDSCLQEVSKDTEKVLLSLNKKIQEFEFTKEDIRRTLLVAVLKGYKTDKISNSEITPDTINLLVGYLVNHLYKDKKKLAILDPVVGTANLLTSVCNNLDSKEFDLVGIDSNLDNIQVARIFADLQDYSVDFILEDAVKSNITGFDLIIGDLPLYIYDDEYFPHVIVDKMINKVVKGGYLIFVIPNDFFEIEGKYKDLIKDKAYLQGIIKLPDNLFVESKLGKSILILRKKDEDIDNVNEFLLVDLPNINDQEKFRNSIKKIDYWFKKEIS